MSAVLLDTFTSTGLGIVVPASDYKGFKHLMLRGSASVNVVTSETVNVRLQNSLGSALLLNGAKLSMIGSDAPSVTTYNVSFDLNFSGLDPLDANDSENWFNIFVSDFQTEDTYTNLTAEIFNHSLTASSKGYDIIHATTFGPVASINVYAASSQSFANTELYVYGYRG